MKISRIIKTYLPISFLLTYMTGCDYNIEEELYPEVVVCDTVTVGFSARVNPIFVNNCVTCHSPGGTQEGYPLNTYDLINSESGAAYARMTDVSDPMPPTGLLDPCEVDAFKKWIDNGKLNN